MLGVLVPVEETRLSVFCSGRLSKEDIERMVQEAEKYRTDDDVQRERVSSKNRLEAYAFNIKSTLEDKNMKGKISDEDKEKMLDKCKEVISWLDRNQVLVQNQNQVLTAD